MATNTSSFTCPLDTAVDDAAGVLGVELKPLQREAIRAFVQGRDVFVCLPTGFGKSLCYALLPAVFDHLLGHKERSIVLCVSPLTALMMEQRSKFTIRGIRAEFVGELQQDILALSAVKSGNIQLLYVSPECILSNPQWREMLLLPVYQENVVALAVDEAHCITMWYVL